MDFISKKTKSYIVIYIGAITTICTPHRQHILELGSLNGYPTFYLSILILPFSTATAKPIAKHSINMCKNQINLKSKETKKKSPVTPSDLLICSNFSSYELICLCAIHYDQIFHYLSVPSS